MILLWTLAFLLCGAGAQYVSLDPQTTAAGQVPEFMIAHFISDSNLQANDTITIDFTGLRTTVPQSVVPPTPGWAPFAAYTKTSYFNEDIQVYSRGPSSTATCYGFGTVNGEGTSIEVGLTACQSVIWAGNETFMRIPQGFLAPNPEYPEVFVDTQLTIDSADGGEDTYSVIVPYQTTVGEYELSRLQLLDVYPGSLSQGIKPNTIQGTPIKALTAHFKPGLQLIAGSKVLLQISADIFRDVAPSAVRPTIAVGACDSEPLRPYCCDKSEVEIYRGIFWSAAAVTLGPLGCIVAADKAASMRFPATLLGSNPYARVSELDPNGLGGYIVNSYLSTSAEPTPTIAQRYGWFRNPVNPASFADPLAINSSDFSGNYLPYRELQNTWVTGSSAVRDLTVTPSTVTANVQPSSMQICFTLGTDLPTEVNASWSQTVVLTANQGVFRPNVRQGYVNDQNCQSLPAGTTLPNACRSACFWTTSFSTLLVKLNPLKGPNEPKQPGCAGQLTAGTRVCVTVPESALLPNLAAGTPVYFDASVRPAFTEPIAAQVLRVAAAVDPNNNAVDYDFGRYFGADLFPIRRLLSLPSGGILVSANSVAADVASLMQVLGFTTVAECNLGFQAGSASDVSGLSIGQRCGLVTQIAALSPATGAILQCPRGATVGTAGQFVTFVKIPEATFSTPIWPQSIQPAAWPQNVALPGTPAIVITNWGFMISTPMFAIVVSYPPTSSSVANLGINPAVPNTWILVFIVKINRFTMSCSLVDDFNPWQFEVAIARSVVAVLVFKNAGERGTPAQQSQGSSWGQSNGIVVVSLTHSATVVGYTAVITSPVASADEGSNDALFGLLALIAIPLLLCCCLAALLWWLLRRRNQPCPCPQNSVQEVYWVNAQQTQPLYMVETCAMNGGVPPGSPFYVAQ